jgi:hypothetical protein
MMLVVQEKEPPSCQGVEADLSQGSLTDDGINENRE